MNWTLAPRDAAAVGRDHGYASYGAVSRIAPTIHNAEHIGIFSINGTSAGDGTLFLTDRSAVHAASVWLAQHGFEMVECLDVAGAAVAAGEEAVGSHELHYAALRTARD